MMVTIAHTATHYHDTRTLIRAYQSWLGIDLNFQGFEQELETLPEIYGPPSGAMVLAYDDLKAAGCVGLKGLNEKTCEMKRMFVMPVHQGKGIGRELFEAFMNEAEVLGYESIRLDTLRSLDRALSLYRSAGFIEIGPYRYNPDPSSIYMELSIEKWRTSLSIGRVDKTQ